MSKLRESGILLRISLNCLAYENNQVFALRDGAVDVGDCPECHWAVSVLGVPPEPAFPLPVERGDLLENPI